MKFHLRDNYNDAISVCGQVKLTKQNEAFYCSSLKSYANLYGYPITPIPDSDICKNCLAVKKRKYYKVLDNVLQF